MKTEKTAFVVVLGVIVIQFLAYLSIIGGIVYVAAHFLRKLW